MCDSGFSADRLRSLRLPSRYWSSHQTTPKNRILELERSGSQSARNTRAMNTAPRLVQSSVGARSSQWACYFCRHAPPSPFFRAPRLRKLNVPGVRRSISTSTPYWQQTRPQSVASDPMEQIRAKYSKRNTSFLYGPSARILARHRTSARIST